MVDLNIVIGPPIDIFRFKLNCTAAMVSSGARNKSHSKYVKKNRARINRTLTLYCWGWLDFPQMFLLEISESKTTQIHSSWVPISLKSPPAVHAHFPTVCTDLRRYVCRSASMHSHPTSVLYWRWLTHPHMEFEMNIFNDSNGAPVKLGDDRKLPISTLTKLSRK